nr:hypothetical protein [Chloroflexota bacterium]
RDAKCSVIVEPGDAAMSNLHTTSDLPTPHPTGEPASSDAIALLIALYRLCLLSAYAMLEMCTYN